VRARALQRAGRAPEAELALAIARGLAGLLPVATAFAITLGIAPLLFLQVLYGQLFYTSSVLMAWLWLAVIPLLLIGYYGYYGLSYARDRMGPGSPWLAFLSGAAFLLVAMAFALNATLMLRPERFHGLYAASELGLHVHLDEPMLVPRLVHMVVAAFAMTGLAVAFVGAARARIDRALGDAMRASGVTLFMWATLLQLGVGPWFLLSVPERARAAFLGGHAEDTAVLAASVVLALAALVVVRRSLAFGAALVGLTVAGMAVVRHRVRALTLEPVFVPDALAVRPQWGVFVVFLACLAFAALVVAWMVTRLAAGRPAEERP
jgi:hypothetical protein